MLGKAVAVFVVAMLLDAVWALYIRRAAAGRAAQAATYALGIIVFGAFNTMSYVEQPVLLVPIAVGSWLGTYLIVRYEHQGANHGKEDAKAADL